MMDKRKIYLLLFLVLSILVVLIIYLYKTSTLPFNIPNPLSRIVTNDQNAKIPSDVTDTYKKLESKISKIDKNELKNISGIEGDIDTYSEINKVDDYMKTIGTSYLNAEEITIWYNNFPSNKYTLEERKKIAYDLLSSLREKVIANQLTMEQAGTELINNKSLADIDSAWETNSYNKIKYAKKDVPSYLDPNLEKQLWNLKEGEISEILEGNDLVNGVSTPAFYTVIKVTQKEDKTIDSYTEFIK